jgi:hypothetical protein
MSTVPTAKPGTVATSNYWLEFAGALAGHMLNASGGTPFAEVIEERFGPDRIVRKHITNLHYNDIKVSFGPNTNKRLLEWIEGSVKGKLAKDQIRQNGALLRFDFNQKEVARLEFQNAIFTELTIPAVDASSKQHVLFELAMTPESTKRVPPKETKLPQQPSKRDSYLAAHFKIDIPPFTEECSRVTKVDAITIKQKVARDRLAEEREHAVEPGSLEYSHLAISLPESRADRFYKWFEDFVIKGNNGQDMEKNGKLEFLSQDLKKVLFTLNLNYMGIFKIEPVREDEPELRRVKVEMYVQELELKFAQPQ